MKILLPIEDPIFASVLIEFISRHRWPEFTEFHLIHVLEPFLIEQRSHAKFAQLLSQSEAELFRIASHLLEDAAAEIKSRIKDADVSFEVKTGRVLSELITAAHQLHADLIIAGSHGRSGFNRMLLGSVSFGLVNEAPCPVLLVKPQHSVLQQWERIPPNSMSEVSVHTVLSKMERVERPNRILVCVEDKDVSNKCVGFLLKHKWTQPAHFKILSAIAPIQWAGFVPLPNLEMLRIDLLNSRKDMVRVLALKLRENDPRSVVHEEIIEADPKHGIIEAAKNWDADMIVIACPHQQLHERHRLGSVSLRVLSAAPCSVLYLRDGTFGGVKRDLSATAVSFR